MISYVTYDVDGNLTGAYLQDLQDDQAAAYIVVSDSERMNWTAYRANPARDGVELIPVAAPSIADLADQYKIAIQEQLDKVAAAFGYGDDHVPPMAAAVSYAEEPAVPKFQAEGRALRAWRSLVWAACYSMFDAVQAGTMPLPSLAEVLASLPAAPIQDVIE